MDLCSTIFQQVKQVGSVEDVPYLSVSYNHNVVEILHRMVESFE